MNHEQKVAAAPILAAAARLLSQKYGRDVSLGDAVQLSEDDRRNLLLRVRDVSGPASASFIIKKVVVEKYDPEDTTSWDSRRFFSDWGGAEFLSGILDVPRTPRFYGGDYSLGFFILEDLGEHRSLVEPLLEGDASGAEGALLSFSSCLGSVHAGTIGQSAAFENVLSGIGPQVATFSRALEGTGERVNKFLPSLSDLGVLAETGFEEEVRGVITAIESPGPFSSYIHGDPCPDNVFWDGKQLRLIDFEFGGFGHALVDAVYGRMMFPTCWCANRLPNDVISKMESVYRSELVKGCPEAQDDRIFESAMARVCGFWLLSTLGGQLARALEADGTWGIGTMRQRVLARLEAFVATTEQFGQLPALRGTANRLLDVLRGLWRDTDPLPLYPAFRSPRISCD